MRWPSDGFEPWNIDTTGWDKEDWAQHHKRAGRIVAIEKELISIQPDWNVTTDRPASPHVSGSGALFGDDSDDELHLVWETRDYSGRLVERNGLEHGAEFIHPEEQEQEHSTEEIEKYRPGTTLDNSQVDLGTTDFEIFSDAQLDRWILEVQPAVLRKARYMGRRFHETDQDELAQRAMLRLVEKAQEYRGHSSFETFALTCAHNDMLNTLNEWTRGRQNVWLAGDFDLGEAKDQHQDVFADPCYEQARHAEVLDALESSPDAELLKLAIDMSDEELAAELGMTYEAARKRRLRAAKKLMAAIDPA